MIQEVSGDILLTKADAIAHGVAPNDDFKKGLAMSLRKEWPAMYKDFRHYCHTKHPKEGGLWTWGGVGGARIVALFTQKGGWGHGEHPGRATVHMVDHALKDLRRVIEKEGWKSIALSRIATGAGGLDWKEVAPLVEKHLGDLPATVYVYTTFHAGEQGAES